MTILVAYVQNNILLAFLWVRYWRTRLFHREAAHTRNWSISGSQVGQGCGLPTHAEFLREVRDELSQLV